MTRNRNTIISSVYLLPEQRQFINDLAKCERRSQTKQIEKMLNDWERDWVKEHGDGAKETMRKFVVDTEERAKKRFGKEEKEDE